MHDHSHNHGVDDVSDRVLGWTIILNMGLSVFEFAGGIISGSVALMADALHNTNDAAALLIAYIARRISRRGADRSFTFGYRRAELIGAMIQLTALIIIGLYLIYEAVSRFISPEPILGKWVIMASLVALVVDAITAWLLWAMSKGSLNVRAAFLHNLTDAAASIAVLLGGIAIYTLGLTWIDPMLTLIIAGYILYMSFNLLKRTSSILMGAAPHDVDFSELKNAIESQDAVVDMHHLHVWEIDEHQRAMEAHVVIQDEHLNRIGEITTSIKSLLREQFNIIHTTLEIEKASEACQHDDAKMIPSHH